MKIYLIFLISKCKNKFKHLISLTVIVYFLKYFNISRVSIMFFRGKNSFITKVNKYSFLILVFFRYLLQYVLNCLLIIWTSLNFLNYHIKKKDQNTIIFIKENNIIDLILTRLVKNRLSTCKLISSRIFGSSISIFIFKSILTKPY